MKNRRYIVVGVLLNFICAYKMIYSHNEDLLKPLHEKIRNNFINMSSSTVGHRVKKGKPLSNDFQEFLNKDELVAKMVQVYGNGKGEFSVKVINKKDEIIEECKHKHDQLNAENTASIQNAIWAKIGCVASALMVGGGVVFGLSDGVFNGHTNHRKQFTGVGIATVGAAALLYGWYEWSRNLTIQEEKQLHITEITKIEEKWDHSFSEMQKKHEHKHGNSHGNYS